MLAKAGIPFSVKPTPITGFIILISEKNKRDARLRGHDDRGLISRVGKIQASLNALQPVVHAELHRFQPQIVVAQIVDVLAYPDKLARMIGLYGLHLRNISLNLLQDFIDKLVRHISHGNILSCA